MEVTILTPTYNRVHTLKKLYDSLRNQTCKNFEWLIVDDGSTDGTDELIKHFIEDANFKIKYLFKKNEGKHTAINFGVNHINSKYTFIVDSDDYLTNNAIELIISKWSTYKENKSISSIWFLQQNESGIIVGDEFSKDEFISKYTNVLINSKIRGDKRAVYLTSIRKEFSFPTFEAEKFLGESTVHKRISNKYSSVFVNTPIYIGDYLEDGLTNAGKNMRLNNPNGGMINSKEFLSKDVILPIRMKKMMLYIIYGLKLKKNIMEIIISSGYPVLAIVNLPLAFITYIRWNYIK